MVKANIYLNGELILTNIDLKMIPRKGETISTYLNNLSDEIIRYRVQEVDWFISYGELSRVSLYLEDR